MSQKFKSSIEIDGSVTATSIVKSGGTASQFLKADGSVDSSSYSSTSHTHTSQNVSGWYARDTTNIDTFDPDGNWTTAISTSTTLGTKPTTYTNIHNLGGDGVNHQSQIATYYGGNNRTWIRSKNDTTDDWVAWDELITSANIGSQSVSSAATLTTARSINGTNFNGSANITTANWGTARTLTIGNTGKSVNGSGNVSWSLSEIGALPAAGGTLTGVLVVGTGASIAYADTDGTYIPRPAGGSYKTATAAHTGAIKIKLPGNIPADMMSFWVDIFDYDGASESESVSLYIYGYAYTNATPYWANVGAVVLTDRTDRDYNVRFGWDGTNHCVTIGEITSSWNYPQVNVRDLQAGYTATYTTFDDNFAISFVTTLPTIGLTASANYVAAKTAQTLQTARTINGVSFNGSANITITANTPQTLTRGTYLTGSNFNGGTATTWAVDATNANTASKVVARDASGNFSAGTITAALSGNASTATTWATARTLTIGGTGKSVNGSGNVSWTLAEIGAAATSHTHSATDITSGTLADARLSGLYTGITLQTNGGNTHYTTPNSGSSSTNDRTVFGLAQYKNDGSAAVGAIVFYAPNTDSTIMHRLRIEGMIYSGGPTMICIVQGYRTTGAWSNTSKINLGISDVQVRFAVDAAGKNCVILGDVATTWSYPMMAITHAMFSHSGVTDAYCKDWTVGLVTSLTGFTQLTATLGNSAISTNILGTAATASATAFTLTRGSYLTGNNFNGSASTTWAVDATNANTASKVVARDASGNFSAGTITAALSGNASTATAFSGTRTVTLTGDVTGSTTTWTGSGTLSIATTIAANSVALGTDTTGNYVAGATAGQGINITGTAAEGWSPTIALKALDLTLFPSSNFKKSVKVATTTNITLSGTQTIDGIAVAVGDRVLVKNATPSQNGIYIVASGAWTRSVAADGSNEIDNAIVAVDQGTTNGGFYFTNTFKTTDVVGTTSMPWYRMVHENGSWGINVTGSAASLTTARTFTIGSTGKTFNGTANLSWTLAEIGVPSTTGFGASGSWGISVTGSAASLTTARTFTIGSGAKTFNGTANLSWTLAEIGVPSTSGYGATGTWGIGINTSTSSQIVGSYTGSYTTDSSPQALLLSNTSASTASQVLKIRTSSSTSMAAVSFWNLTTLRGHISVTGSGTTYNSVSDYRLKENIVDLENASDRLMKLKPKRFSFIDGDGQMVDGFLAHEAQEVVPEAVEGQKDAVDENGNPAYQGIDQSKLIPLLTAALQDALKRIDQLEKLIQTK